jgi:hypothetical protein
MNYLTFRSILVCLGLGACALAQAQTAPRGNVIMDEPITLPKIDAGRVTARVNDKPVAVGSNERVIVERVGGSTIIRVNSEGAAPYTLSNVQPGTRLLRRDHDEMRVPMWQIGKF